MFTAVARHEHNLAMFPCVDVAFAHGWRQRLYDKGYYDEFGQRKMSYRERHVTIFKKRRWLHQRSHSDDPVDNGMLDNLVNSPESSVKSDRNHPVTRPEENGVGTGKNNPIMCDNFISMMDSDHPEDPLIIQTKTHNNVPPAYINKNNLKLIRVDPEPETIFSLFWQFFQRFLIFMHVFGATAVMLNIKAHLHRLEMEVKNRRQDLAELRNTVHPKAYSLPDFALGTHGGKILHDLSSETYPFETKWWCRKIPPWLEYKNPNSVISGQIYPLIPGHCWPFKGQIGHLFIELAHEIHITHVSLGHISKDRSPVGQTLSAPKRFTVYGLKTVNGEETKLGTFEYDNDGNSLQTFKIYDHTHEVFRYVKLAVESNYGNPVYTCLYNFKVLGHMV